MSSSEEEDSQNEDYTDFGERKRRRRTRDDAIYGIFGDEEDNDNNRRQSRSSTSKAYAKPVSFVTGGSERQAEVEKDDVAPVELPDYKKWDEQIVPASFGKKKSASSKSYGGAGSRKSKKSGGGERLRKADTSFERFTKGIGSKLMAKMGYHGGGIKPIEVKVRPGGMGLGYGNFQERTDNEPKSKKKQRGGRQTAEEESDEDEEDDDGHNEATRAAARAVEREDRDGWKKGRSRRQQQQYLQALDQESRDAAAKNASLSSTIIDMRGPDTRVINSNEISSSSGGNRRGGDRQRMPELYYNVRLLLDVVRVELLNVDGKQAERTKQIKSLEDQQKIVEDQISRETAQIERIKRLQSLIKECSIRVEKREIELNQVNELFLGLQNQFEKEYDLFKLSRLLHSLAFPLLKEKLRTWQPLVDPSIDAKHAQTLFSWRKVLLKRHQQDEDSENAAQQFADDVGHDELDLLVGSDAARHDAQLYQQIIDELVVPIVRLALMRRWKPQQSASAMALLASWRRALPVNTWHSLLEQQIVPMLQRAVDDGADALHLHEWLLPWRTILGAKMNALNVIAARAVTKALKRPATACSEAGRRALDAWQPFLDSRSVQKVLDNGVLPALTHQLKSMTIDPRAPDPAPLNAALSWHNFATMRADTLVNVLETGFFPTWLRVLRQWATQEGRVLAELADWYQGWKELVPSSLVADSGRLRLLFNHALDVLKCSAMNLPLPDAPPPPSAARRRAAQLEYAAKLGASTPDEDSGLGKLGGLTSLREAVSELAAERHIPFARAARLYDGRAAYTLGSSIVRFENGLLMERGKRGGWTPTSVDEIMQRASQPVPSPSNTTTPNNDATEDID